MNHILLAEARNDGPPASLSRYPFGALIEQAHRWPPSEAECLPNIVLVPRKKVGSFRKLNPSEIYEVSWVLTSSNLPWVCHLLEKSQGDSCYPTPP